MNKEIESNSEKFDLDTFLDCQEKTRQAVRKIASLCEVGMNEEDGHSIIDQVLDEMGTEKKWHPNKFRIGSNTTKAFRELSDPGVRLQPSDLLFIDIGPVFNGHEGDYGETFVFGTDQKYLDIKAASEKLFQICRRSVTERSLTGVQLYEFATQQAIELGYQLNLKMAGHRLGDFPHAVFYKKQLGSTELTPSPNKWILEILIKHPSEEFGAFFEDLI